MADPLKLDTEDIDAVPILSAGGPYHGLGSPPEGDFITVEDLEGMAAAGAALRGVVNAPLKLGHNDTQPILASAGLPAAGWLDNLRVVGSDLVADFKRVPKTVAALIRAGGYRARSVEFRPMSHAGQRWPKVVTGTALLGAELPAVKTLGDIVALYAADPAAETLREKGGRAYITPIPALEAEDATTTPAEPLVEAPTEAQPDGQPVEAMAAGAAAPVTAPTEERTPTQAQENPMPDLSAIAGALGLAEDADEQAIVEAARAAKARQDEVADTAKTYGDPTLSVASIITEATKGLVKADDLEARGYVSASELEAVKAKADAAEQRLYEMRRDSLVEAAVRDGRLSAHQANEWRGYMDASPELVERQLADLPVREDLVREYGEASKPGADEAAQDAEELAYARAFGGGDA